MWLMLARRRRAARILALTAIALATLLVGAVGIGLVRSVLVAQPAAAAMATRADEPEPTPKWWRERPAPSEPAARVAHDGDAEGSSSEVREPDPRMQPASGSGRKLIALKDEIQQSLTHTAYEHRTRVRPKEGVYVWDCSAMAGWMLRKIAPRARKAMDKGRPVARDFYRKIKRSPTRRARDGWRRLAHIEDVRPGDMFAWERPPGFPSKNTGHVGFAIEPARPVPEWPGAYTLRIVDATSLPHQDDTRRRKDGGGIGEGTILFMTDGDGRGIGYGWFGRRSRGVIVTDIGFARLSR